MYTSINKVNDTRKKPEACAETYPQLGLQQLSNTSVNNFLLVDNYTSEKQNRNKFLHFISVKIV